VLRPCQSNNLVRAAAPPCPGFGTDARRSGSRSTPPAPKEEALALAAAIEEVKERVRFCRECGNLTEEELCAICTTRGATDACVRRRAAGRRLSLERTHEYRGLYHVLGGALSPLDGVEPATCASTSSCRASSERRRRRSCSRRTRT
jgi:recombination protein RecR